MTERSETALAGREKRLADAAHAVVEWWALIRARREYDGRMGELLYSLDNALDEYDEGELA